MVWQLYNFFLRFTIIYCYIINLTYIKNVLHIHTLVIPVNSVQIKISLSIFTPWKLVIRRILIKSWNIFFL